MAIGTAGYTAMLCVQALEDAGLTPDKDAEVLVTGAAGGVGSVAVTLLAQKGYRVIAATGRPETHDYLKRSEEHTSELQSLMRISYAVFCLKKKKQTKIHDKLLTHRYHRFFKNVTDNKQINRSYT